MTVEFDSLCSNGKDYCPEINEHSQFCINVAQQKVPFSLSDFSRTADLWDFFLSFFASSYFFLFNSQLSELYFCLLLLLRRRLDGARCQ